MPFLFMLLPQFPQLRRAAYRAWNLRQTSMRELSHSLVIGNQLSPALNSRSIFDINDRRAAV
jgi:hypothetical protein